MSGHAQIVGATCAFYATPELESPQIEHPFMSEMSLIEVGDEQARLQVVKGRLDALRSILAQLSSALNSLNETHVYVAGQVRDLEAYIEGLAPTNVVPGERDSDSAVAVKSKAARSRGLTGGKFWSKLHLNL